MGLALSVFTLLSRGDLPLEMAAIVLGVAVIVFVIFSRLPKRET